MIRPKSLPGVPSLAASVLMIAVLCSLTSAAPGSSQTTVVDNSPTTPCVTSIVKFYFPSGPPATFHAVVKYLTGPKTCTTAVSNSASCLTNPSDLAAEATSAQLMGNPSCQWNCVGCGTITTNAMTDGLPVELMDFEVVDGAQDGASGGDVPQPAETHAEAPAHGSTD